MERNPTNPSPAATLRIIEARRDTRRCLAALAVLALLVVGGPAAAQFTAGSDGSDGALDFTGRCSGTLLWDASETRPDGQVLDPEGDGIFHFTTVTVPQGCTLRMLASRLGHKPIQWLVQGNVSISGDLNLDGTDGHSNQEGVALRLPAVPGPGGFAGGLGSLGGNADEPGFGPGGGLPGRGGAHSGSPGAAAGTSPSYGNIFLLPLLGGSGGGGSGGAGGGAGGGALLIASDTRINFPTNRDVFIRARGGDGVTGGAGGAIRLMAPTISGRAFIDTCSLRSCGLTGNLVGEFGRVRIESNNLSSNVRTARAVARRVRLTNTSPVLTTVDIPSLAVTAFATASGVVHPVDVNPRGGFSPADVTFPVPGELDPVTIDIEAVNVPVGTIVNVEIHGENFGTSSVQSTPLVGTEAFSTATATFPFAAGFSHVTLFADFTPAP